jgi:uncharacterized protein with PIN domain
MQHAAKMRFYEELNDFLPREYKKTEFSYKFNGSPAVKDAIEAVGVPHPEVDLILVNGVSVGFDHHLQHGDRVAVYPVFESLDITPLLHLREKPLRRTSFVLDIHLGKLARLLRLFGFDCLYRNDYADEVIITISVDEKRIILTRDQGILKHKRVTHGYWVRSTRPKSQLTEVLNRFDLWAQVKPFNRCLLCNGVIKKVAQKEVAHRLPPKTAQFYKEYFQCSDCQKVYWQGSHYKEMVDYITQLQREKR